MTLDLSTYKPGVGTSGDANQIANGFQAIQDAINGLSAAAPGYEYGRQTFTSNKTVTATVEASADTVVTAPSVTVDGATAIQVEFGCYEAVAGTTFIEFFLFDGAASLGNIATHNIAGKGLPVHVRTDPIVPSAGAHIYSVRAIVDGGSGIVGAGAGGAGSQRPGFVRVVKV